MVRFQDMAGATRISISKRSRAPRILKTGVGRLANLGIGPGESRCFRAPPKYGKTDLVTQLAVDGVRDKARNDGADRQRGNAAHHPGPPAKLLGCSGVPIERFTAGNLPGRDRRGVTAARDAPIESGTKMRTPRTTGWTIAKGCMRRQSSFLTRRSTRSTW